MPKQDEINHVYHIPDQLKDDAINYVENFVLCKNLLGKKTFSADEINCVYHILKIPRSC